MAGPDFRRLLAVRLAGQFADGLFQAALFSAVFFNPERATSAGQAAAGFATLLLPYSVVGPFAGVFLDRWRRQRVLLDRQPRARRSCSSSSPALLGVLGPTSAPVVAPRPARRLGQPLHPVGPVGARCRTSSPTRLLVTANSFSTTLGAGAAAARRGDRRRRCGCCSARTTSARAARRWSPRPSTSPPALLAARIAADAARPGRPAAARALRAALGAVARGVGQGAAHVRERGPAARGLAAISAHRFFYGLSFVATLLLYTEQGAIGRGFAGLGEVVVVSVARRAARGARHARARPAGSGTQRWIVLVFAAAAVVEVVVRAALHARRVPRRRLLPRLRRAGVEDLRRHAAAGVGRGRLPRPRLLLLRHAVQPQLRVRRQARRRSCCRRTARATGRRRSWSPSATALTALVYGVATARRAAQEPPEPVLGSGRRVRPRAEPAPPGPRCPARAPRRAAPAPPARAAAVRAPCAPRAGAGRPGRRAAPAARCSSS